MLDNIPSIILIGLSVGPVGAEITNLRLRGVIDTLISCAIAVPFLSKLLIIYPDHGSLWTACGILILITYLLTSSYFGLLKPESYLMHDEMGRVINKPVKPFEIIIFGLVLLTVILSPS